MSGCRRIHRVALLAWTLAACLPASRVAAQTAQTDQIMLVYDSQRLVDHERAQLIAYVSEAVPQSRWAEVKIQSPMSIAKLIDEYYDVFEKKGDKHENPLSAQMLAIYFREANKVIGDLVPAGTIKMPPVPVRAHTDYRKNGTGPERLRVFDAGTHKYTEKATTRRDQVPDPHRLVIKPAKFMDEQRDATTTGILLDLADVQKTKPVALPDSVLVINARRSAANPRLLSTHARIDLLAAPAADCTNAFASFDGSPFRAQHDQLIGGLSPARKAELVALAGRRKLVIVDTQVKADHGHGRKVYRVAQQTLKHLGLDQLGSAIETFDLTPSSAEAIAALTGALKDYKKSKPPNTADGDFKDAEDWIESHSATAQKTMWPNQFDVPQLLLEAVFHKFLIDSIDDSDPNARVRTWVNMSFRISSPALQTTMKRFNPKTRLAFVAAGNDFDYVPKGLSPHDGASDTKNIILVTNGDANGVVGSYGASDEDEVVGPPVAVVAPGCGFDGLKESGSSFASPYVAAAVWMQFLIGLDESKPDDDLPAVIRRIGLASRPSRKFERTMSHGLFDPAQLSADPGTPHIVLAEDKRSVPLKHAKLVVSCKHAGGISPMSYETTTFPGADWKTFTVERDGDQSRLLVRTVSDKTQTVVVCETERLTFDVETTSGPLPTMDLKQFADEVIAFTGRFP